LSILRLHNVTIVANSPFTLPRLAELSWVLAKATESWTSNLDLQSFPSLRIVSIFAPIDRDNRVEATLEVLSRQVDVIALNTNLSWLSPNLFARIKDKTLVEFDGTNFKLTSHIPYLRIKNVAFASAFTLAKLTHYVLALPTSISSTLLYLPLQLQPVSAHSVEHRKSLESFLDCCAAKKVEVIFEEQSIDWDVFWKGSADFRKRMRAKQARD